MRKIDLIVIHCSATRMTRPFPPEALEACHRSLGFLTTGYHYYITRDGVIHPCRPEEMAGAHARRFNAHSLGVCYEGGLDAQGRPADTRTEAQKRSMLQLIGRLKADYPRADIVGHRDLPGVRKACPCFDVKQWLQSAGRAGFPIPAQ